MQFNSETGNFPSTDRERHRPHPSRFAITQRGVPQSATTATTASPQPTFISVDLILLSVFGPWVSSQKLVSWSQLQLAASQHTRRQDAFVLPQSKVTSPRLQDTQLPAEHYSMRSQLASVARVLRDWFCSGKGSKTSKAKKILENTQHQRYAQHSPSKCQHRHLRDHPSIGHQCRCGEKGAPEQRSEALAEQVHGEGKR